MITPVLLKTYSEIPMNYCEVLRYSGALNADDAVRSLVDECIAECNGKFVFKVCYREVDIAVMQDTVDMEFVKVSSHSLARNLEGCDSAVIFCATVGLEIDRLIARYSKISPSKSVIFQAIGAERIESLCDTFCLELGLSKPRFSPGYGDLSLSLQSKLLTVLDAPRKIGVSLNSSMLMSPSKSVSAIVGRNK